MNNYAMFSYINITPVCHIGPTKAMYGNVFKKSICHQTRRGLGTAVLLPSKLRPIIKQEKATFLLYWLPEDNINYNIIFSRQPMWREGSSVTESVPCYLRRFVLPDSDLSPSSGEGGIPHFISSLLCHPREVEDRILGILPRQLHKVVRLLIQVKREYLEFREKLKKDGQPDENMTNMK